MIVTAKYQEFIINMLSTNGRLKIDAFENKLLCGNREIHWQVMPQL